MSGQCDSEPDRQPVGYYCPSNQPRIALCGEYCSVEQEVEDERPRYEESRASSALPESVCKDGKQDARCCEKHAGQSELFDDVWEDHKEANPGDDDQGKAVYQLAQVAGPRTHKPANWPDQYGDGGYA